VKTKQQAAAMITSSDKKAGIACTEPSIPYRYPPIVVPPPLEVCDFGLPLGGKLHRLMAENSGSSSSGGASSNTKNGLMVEEIYTLWSRSQQTIQHAGVLYSYWRTKPSLLLQQVRFDSNVLC